MTIQIIDAIKAINISAEVAVRGHDIDDCEIEWHNDTAEISKEDIKTKIKELETAYQKTEYQRKRVNEYPPIGDQLDALYHGGVFPKEMADLIKSVKDKYPKG